MPAAAESGRRAGRREVTTDHAKEKRARELRAQELAPADIGRIIGASRATVYRYLSIGSNDPNR
jgi:DNA invertase Pin-like site-specific DNA recombinase